MKKLILFTLLAGALFTGVMGFAHTKAGRPLLAGIGRLFGKEEFCPLGYDVKVTAAQRIARRTELAKHFAKAKSASSRKFLDFDFGQATRSDVKTWIVSHGGNCKNLASDFDIECQGADLGAHDSTFWLEFDERGHLASAKSLQNFTTLDQAKSDYLKGRQELTSSAKGPIALIESGPLAQIEQGLLRQAVAQSDFSNFSSQIRITNLGASFAVSRNATAF